MNRSINENNLFNSHYRTIFPIEPAEESDIYVPSFNKIALLTMTLLFSVDFAYTYAKLCNKLTYLNIKL